MGGKQGPRTWLPQKGEEAVCLSTGLSLRLTPSSVLVKPKPICLSEPTDDHTTAQHLAYDSHSTVFDPRPIRSQVPHSCMGPALFMSQLSLWPSCSTLAQLRRKPVCVACNCSHRGPNHADPCLWTTSTGPRPPSPSEPTPADLPFRSLDWLQPSLRSLESPTA